MKVRLTMSGTSPYNDLSVDHANERSDYMEGDSNLKKASGSGTSEINFYKGADVLQSRTSYLFNKKMGVFMIYLNE